MTCVHEKRKSARPYISLEDINNGDNDCFDCPVYRTVRRNKLLKGKCFGVGRLGIYVGSNRDRIFDRLSEDEQPDIEFTENGTHFIDSYDNRKSSVEPTHITLIDKSGKYL